MRKKKVKFGRKVMLNDKLNVVITLRQGGQDKVCNKQNSNMGVKNAMVSDHIHCVEFVVRFAKPRYHHDFVEAPKCRFCQKSFWHTMILTISPSTQTCTQLSYHLL